MKIGRFSAFTAYVCSEDWNVSVRFSNERIDDFTDKLKKDALSYCGFSDLHFRREA